MPRAFNTSGPCNSAKHYMLPAAERLPDLEPLLVQELWFTVHAPRQTGKTTAFLELARRITAAGRYAALHVSCEAGQATRSDPGLTVEGLIESLVARAHRDLPPELQPPSPQLVAGITYANRLESFLTLWAEACPLPLVLFLDEIDTLIDDSLITVLRQLRKGFPHRPGSFPSSVALIGLRDVRDYKIRSAVRPEQDTLGTASPFNVKARALTLRNFTQAEVAELLGQHTAETGQRFEEQALAAVFEQSQGQPWLVNALAGQLTTEFDALVPDRARTVTAEHVSQARELLIARRDTHLDSLVDRLQEERIRKVIEPILTGSPSFDPTFDDNFSYVRDLGLVRLEEGRVRIANPIYQEIIPRVLTFRVQVGIDTEPAWYVAPDGTLDMAKLIDGFVTFWRENGEILLAGQEYHEAAPHLAFMAWLQRIANGGGRVTREFALGTRRTDLMLEFGGRQDVIELKLADSPRALPRGLEQVTSYARRLGRDRGYLILFDRQGTLPWEKRGQIEEQVHEGVTVVVVRV